MTDPIDTATAAPADTLPEPGTEKKILLIEDEAIFAEMFGKALRDVGYAVVSERDGQSGLDRARSGAFDLIITDHLLPSLSGKEIIEALKNETGSKSVPIFLLTASLDEAEVKTLEASGAVERSFMKTQITPSELATVAKEFFASR